ncbi:MAG: type I-E CRISPR-associated protein Cse1/CasA [Armatimonadetes bacterium]|nr:type I-E CRISPR-associated protein Cse1/CasA [Armatimonadota bacterium]
MHPSFNLVDEPWIPCLTPEGQAVTLGLRDVLRRSAELAEVRAPSPLGTAALIRLLLAVLHATLRGPRDTAERACLWRGVCRPCQGRRDTAERACLWRDPRALLDAVDGYLAKWRDRFDLFHPEYPFWQEAALRLEKPRRITFIALELSAPEEFGLFDPPIDKAAHAASAADAARYLVTRQSYTLGGLDRAQNRPYGMQRRFESSPPVLGALVFVTGRNLLKTLLLNLVPYTERVPIPATAGRPDAPIWERDSLPWGPGERAPDGYLDYLTWPSSAIRLEPEWEGGRVVVRTVHICARNKVWPGALAGDPFFAWRDTQPLALRRSRALWRDSGALFGFVSDERVRRQGQVPKPPVLRELAALASRGVATHWGLLVVGADAERRKQQVHMWRAESLPLPRAVLEEGDAVQEVARAVQLGEAVGGSLGSALQKMARQYLSLGREGAPNGDDVTRLARSWNAEAQYWPALESPFRRFLADLCAPSPDFDAALLGWQAAVRRAAWAAYDTAARQLGEDAAAFRARIHGERLLGDYLHWHLPAKEKA